jgi:exonuclease VII large subunit
MFERAAHDMLKRKEERLEATESYLRMQAPQKRVKAGWGQIVRDGKLVAVHTLEKGDRFEVHSVDTIIEAECLSKKKLL